MTIRTIRVLVADDQSMVRAGFRMLLAGEDDIEVVAEASNGLEAIDKASRFQPSLVLMDIRMPELDGLEATRRILAADGSARILILTTFDLDEYIYEALRAGASGFVLKDDPPEQLIAAVRTVAAGDALLSPAITKRVISEFTRVPRPSPPKEVDELSERERDVFRLIARGLSNAEIGSELFIGETTVKTHVTHILQKLNLRDRVQAVVLAYQTGLFQADAPQSSSRDERVEVTARTSRLTEHAGSQRVLATVLFTDIVGATELTSKLGDSGWRQLLERHHAIVRRELARFQGRELDTAGDGFFATFEGPARAVFAASAIRDSLRTLEIEIRAGLHTGECVITDGKVAGVAVSIGARIASLAAPGEVLVSSTVKDLVAGSDLRFENRGAHHLKGVPDTWQLFAVAG